MLWFVWSPFFLSKSFSPCTNPVVTVPSASITIGISITFIFHSFFSSLSRSRYLFLFAFLQFYFVASQKSKVHYLGGSLFLLTITRSGHLAEIWWSVCISKSQRSLCVSFYRIDSGLYIFVRWSNLNFLQNSLCITLPTQPCLVLYS